MRISRNSRGRGFPPIPTELRGHAGLRGPAQTDPKPIRSSYNINFSWGGAHIPGPGPEYMGTSPTARAKRPGPRFTQARAQVPWAWAPAQTRARKVDFTMQRNAGPWYMLRVLVLLRSHLSLEDIRAFIRALVFARPSQFFAGGSFFLQFR